MGELKLSEDGIDYISTSSGGDILPVLDTTSLVKDPSDATKQMRMDVGAVATDTTRVTTMPDQDIDLTPGTGSFIKDILSDTTPELGGELDAGAHTIGFTAQVITGDGTTTFDWKLSNKAHFAFGSQNETFTFTAPTNPCNLMLRLTQDDPGGSRTVTWPATVKWGAGTAPTLTTAAGAVDIIAFYFDGTDYHGSVGPQDSK